MKKIMIAVLVLIAVQGCSKELTQSERMIEIVRSYGGTPVDSTLIMDFAANLNSERQDSDDSISFRSEGVSLRLEEDRVYAIFLASGHTDGCLTLSDKRYRGELPFGLSFGRTQEVLDRFGVPERAYTHMGTGMLEWKVEGVRVVVNFDDPTDEELGTICRIMLVNKNL
ncbi:hypothetical protein [Wenzhouxiangella sp. EGI_FJ10409]|uniref:hypothetical protein n=1 Tax=Wenzhouxiangella sp. EGI_FJ10409 TaxID=3243767 RepID=UPI0035DBF90C